MHKSKTFKNRYDIRGYIEEDEHRVLETIAEREHKSLSAINRIAIVDYISKHAAGNNSYTLNMWNDNINFMAIPALLESKNIWLRTIKELDDKSLKDVQDQCRFISDEISRFQRSVEANSDENKKTKERVLTKFIKANDIRYKDPATLTFEGKARRRALRELSGLDPDE